MVATQSTLSACWRAFWLLVSFDRGGGQHLAMTMPVDVGALLARCRLTQRTRGLLETVSRTQLLSGRGITRALMVARTIADIAESKSVAEEHLMEALSFKLRKGV